MELMTFQKGHNLNIGNTYAKGFKHSDEWKEKVRLIMLGNERGFKKGQPSPRKGKKSLKPVWNKGKKIPKLSGSNNPRWKGGKYRDKHSLHNPEYTKWRKNVFERDKYQCQLLNDECRGHLQAHHIKRFADFPELRYEINNGITLCYFHHPRKKIDEDNMVDVFKKIIDSDITHLNLERKAK